MNDSAVSTDDVSIDAVLPDGWETASLASIATLGFGQSPPSETYNTSEQGLPFFQGKAEFGARYPTVQKYCTAPTRVAQKGDILLSIRAPVGPTNIAPCECGIGRGLASIHPDRGIPADYILHYFRHVAVRLAAKGTGTTFGAITKPVVQAVDIPVAPKNSRVRIVSKIDELFSSIDEGEQALGRVAKLVERYRQSVLKAAVTGELTRDWREARKQAGEPAESGAALLARILKARRAAWEQAELAKLKAKGKTPTDERWKQKYKEPAPPDTTDLPELPEGWMWTSAEQVCGFITKGTTPARNAMSDGCGDVPYIKVYNLCFDGTLDFARDPTFIARQVHDGTLARSKLYPGDVVMNIVGPPLGKVSVIPNDYPEWNMNQAVAVFRPLRGLQREFLAHYLLSTFALGWYKSRSKATVGQVNLTLELCRQTPVPLPPSEEQAAVVSLLDRALTGIAHLTGTSVDQRVFSAALRQSILKAAFSGQLVPQDPNDEPASKLLERIAAERANSATRQRKRIKKTA